MKLCKCIFCMLLITVLLFGCSSAKKYSYSDAKKEIEQLQRDIAYADLDKKEVYSAMQRIFGIISKGEPAERGHFAKLTREIINNTVEFKDEEVFALAEDFEKVFAGLSQGKKPGLQSLKLSKKTDGDSEIVIDYLGELLYSVKMVNIEEGWYDKDEYIKVSYNGELGNYLMVIEIRDTQPSDDFMEKYPLNETHKLGTVTAGPVSSETKHDIMLKWIGTDVSGYVIYIGSDMPFSVKEQVATSANWPIGAVSITLSSQ